MWCVPYSIYLYIYILYTNLHIALRMELNPKDSEIFLEGDQVIVIAEDNDTYEPELSMHINKDRMNQCTSIGIRDEPRPEKMLFIGWRRDMDDMVLQVDDCVCNGSELTLFSSVALSDREARLHAGGLDTNDLKHVSLTHLAGMFCTSRIIIIMMHLMSFILLYIHVSTLISSPFYTVHMIL